MKTPTDCPEPNQDMPIPKTDKAERLFVVYRILDSMDQAQDHLELIQLRGTRGIVVIATIALALGFLGMMLPLNLGFVITIPLLFWVVSVILGSKVLQSSYDRDFFYVTHTADYLREAITSDTFETPLAWHLFQMRVSRFDIGKQPNPSTDSRREDRDASTTKTNGAEHESARNGSDQQAPQRRDSSLPQAS